MDKKLVFNLSKKTKLHLPIPTIKQLKHLKKFLSSKEVFFIKIVLAIIGINILIIGGFQYKNHISIIPASGGEYTEGLIGSPKLINPILAQTDVDIDLSKLIFSGLLKYDKDLALKPDIAYAYEISEDQKIYTLHLKNNIFWHDNEKLTANDVLFTFDRIRDPEFNSHLFINFEGVLIEKIDDYTVKFILNEPYSPFLNLLTFGILPEHIWNNVMSQHFSLAEYNIKPIGCGPFKFKSLIKDKQGTLKSITLEAHEKYHNITSLINELTFKFYPDFTSAVESLINKNIQGLSRLPRDQNEKIKTSEKYNIKQLTLPQYTALFFNLSKKNQWVEKEMRQALAYSINKENLINDTLNGNAKIINGPILPGTIGYKEIIKTYDYNIDTANKLFDKQGWKLNENNILTKDEKELSISISTIDRYDNVDIANALKESMENIGIKVELDITPFSQIKQKIKQRNYEVLLYGEVVGIDPDPYPFWHSTQRVDPGLNLSMFADKKIDELIESARQISLEEKRQEKYEQFSDIIIEELPAIFLYSPLYSYVQEKSIKGFDITQIIDPSDRFNNIDEWYMKEKRVWK